MLEKPNNVTMTFYLIYSRTVVSVLGIYSFVWSKNSVDKRRFEDMQIRDRMKKANIGEYESVGTRKFSA